MRLSAIAAMEMFGTGGELQFEMHLERLQEPAKTIMVDLRKFVLSLGSNVIEEVGPHRVVYAKTLNFRTFLDIEPAGDSLVLSVRSGRNAPPVAATVRTAQDAERQGADRAGLPENSVADSKVGKLA